MKAPAALMYPKIVGIDLSEAEQLEKGRDVAPAVAGATRFPCGSLGDWQGQPGLPL